MFKFKNQKWQAKIKTSTRKLPFHNIMRTTVFQSGWLSIFKTIKEKMTNQTKLIIKNHHKTS